MDSDEIKKLQSDRLRYLEKAYHESKGDPDAYMEWKTIGNELGLDENRSNSISSWLEKEDFIKFQASSIFSLTNLGMKTIEDAITKPDEPSGPLIAYNQINIGQMINSNIQQGTIDSIQNQTIQQNDLNAIKNLIEKLEDSLDHLHMTDIQKCDLITDIETIKAQTKSSNPKKQILSSVFNSIKNTLQSIQPIQPLVTQLIPSIVQIITLLSS